MQVIIQENTLAHMVVLLPKKGFCYGVSWSYDLIVGMPVLRHTNSIKAPTCIQKQRPWVCCHFTITHTSVFFVFNINEQVL